MRPGMYQQHQWAVFILTQTAHPWLHLLLRTFIVLKITCPWVIGGGLTQNWETNYVVNFNSSLIIHLSWISEHQSNGEIHCLVICGATCWVTLRMQASFIIARQWLKIWHKINEFSCCDMNMGIWSEYMNVIARRGGQNLKHRGNTLKLIRGHKSKKWNPWE